MSTLKDVAAAIEELNREFPRPGIVLALSVVMGRLAPFKGQQITLADVIPLADALLEHWIRCDISP